jgi:hypothetical protein
MVFNNHSCKQNFYPQVRKLHFKAILARIKNKIALSSKISYLTTRLYQNLAIFINQK